ncbi:hypothetical protein [Spirosoma telluris]|uniref:hypothetical protein n=1 Tax=Spirosoma telluris TaxID=2183553 RepID=UPI002FC2B53A
MPRIAASSATTFCQGESTTLSTAEQASYRWSSGQTSRSIDVRTPGEYTVTVMDQNGCSSPASSLIRVVVNPCHPPHYYSQSLNHLLRRPTGHAYGDRRSVLRVDKQASNPYYHHQSIRRLFGTHPQ